MARRHSHTFNKCPHEDKNKNIPSTRATNIDKCSDNKRTAETSEIFKFKSVKCLKKEWKKLKQIGWGAQGSIFQVQALITHHNKSSIEYVAKIIYLTDENVYKSVEDKQNAIIRAMDEYLFVIRGNLLNYIDFYYDETRYNKVIIIMEKLSHCLNHKRDNKWKGIYSTKRIAKDVALNMKKIHDLHYAHLDIKKENIMYNEREKRWQIIDYGFMKYIDPNVENVKVNKFIGTKSWTAPEIKLLSDTQYEGSSEYSLVSQKCDIYSYGLVLLNIALGGYHYGAFSPTICHLMDSKASSDLEILRMLNTESGNVLLQNYLVSLHKNGVIDHDLYALLAQILVCDPNKRPDIDGILCMNYFKT